MNMELRMNKTILRNAAVSLYAFLILACLVATANSASAADAGAEVNIYSYRQEFLVRPFLEKFTQKIGIKVNVVFANKGMAKRIEVEGRNTKADAVLTVDISRLKAHADKGLLQSINSVVLKTNVPAHLRDPRGTWFGLSKRVRILAVSKTRVKPGAINRYEDLADPKWKGKICVRQGSHVYNRALLASMIVHHGEKGAEKWALGLMANLARKPQGNDRAQARAVYQGVCDIALINNYYYGRMKFNKKKPEQQKWANAVRLVFPNQEDRGTHVNISGAGVTKYAKNRANAVKLLEFLSSADAQFMYAARNFEYPVNQKVKLSEEVASWGVFKGDSVPLGKIADLSLAAQKIIDRVGW
jgi:iron(III) transport system substrate-binding protein